MGNTTVVSIFVMAGIVGLAGVPLRCWQYCSGRFRAQIPPQALARATFNLFAGMILAPNLLAWVYALLAAWRDCTGATAQLGAASALAAGLLGCAYLLLEGFLLAALRRPCAPSSAGSLSRNR
jgi:hypothetical protein